MSCAKRASQRREDLRYEKHSGIDVNIYFSVKNIVKDYSEHNYD